MHLVRVICSPESLRRGLVQLLISDISLRRVLTSPAPGTGTGTGGSTGSLPRLLPRRLVTAPPSAPLFGGGASSSSSWQPGTFAADTARAALFVSAGAGAPPVGSCRAPRPRKAAREGIVPSQAAPPGCPCTTAVTLMMQSPRTKLRDTPPSPAGHHRLANLWASRWSRCSGLGRKLGVQVLVRCMAKTRIHMIAGSRRSFS